MDSGIAATRRPCRTGSFVGTCEVKISGETWNYWYFITQTTIFPIVSGPKNHCCKSSVTAWILPSKISVALLILSRILGFYVVRIWMIRMRVDRLVGLRWSLLGHGSQVVDLRLETKCSFLYRFRLSCGWIGCKGKYLALGSGWWLNAFVERLFHSSSEDSETSMFSIPKYRSGNFLVHTCIC